MDNVLLKKGEGMMLREPTSMYEGKRSDNLLKVKKFDDAEATVIGH
jgi:DNA ligase-1